MKTRSIRNRVFSGLLTAACLLGVSGLSASAAVTPEDIAQKLREQGLPESAVQQGYNELTSGEYSQEDLDEIWVKLEASEGDILDRYYEYFAPTDPTDSTESTEPTEDTQGDAPESDDPVEPTQPATQAPGKEFAKMTLEEKKAYLGGMTDAERRKFLENLTPEERKSLLKQMSVEDKAEILQEFVNVAEEMDLHVSVDKLTNENVSLTIRDEQGTIIDKSEMGIIIDETGISHTGLLVSAAAGVIAALSGLAAISRKVGKDDSTK